MWHVLTIRTETSQGGARPPLGPRLLKEAGVRPPAWSGQAAPSRGWDPECPAPWGDQARPGGEGSQGITADSGHRRAALPWTLERAHACRHIAHTPSSHPVHSRFPRGGVRDRSHTWGACESRCPAAGRCMPRAGTQAHPRGGPHRGGLHSPDAGRGVAPQPLCICPQKDRSRTRQWRLFRCPDTRGSGHYTKPHGHQPGHRGTPGRPEPTQALTWGSSYSRLWNLDQKEDWTENPQLAGKRSPGRTTHASPGVHGSAQPRGGGPAAREAAPTQLGLPKGPGSPLRHCRRPRKPGFPPTEENHQDFSECWWVLGGSKVCSVSEESRQLFE